MSKSNLVRLDFSTEEQRKGEERRKNPVKEKILRKSSLFDNTASLYALDSVQCFYDGRKNRKIDCPQDAKQIGKVISDRNVMRKEKFEKSNGCKSLKNPEVAKVDSKKKLETPTTPIAKKSGISVRKTESKSKSYSERYVAEKIQKTEEKTKVIGASQVKSKIKMINDVRKTGSKTKSFESPGKSSPGKAQKKEKLKVIDTGSVRSKIKIMNKTITEESENLIDDIIEKLNQTKGKKKVKPQLPKLKVNREKSKLEEKKKEPEETPSEKPGVVVFEGKISHDDVFSLFNWIFAPLQSAIQDAQPNSGPRGKSEEGTTKQKLKKRFGFGKNQNWKNDLQSEMDAHDICFKLRRYNSDPHSRRGFIWKHLDKNSKESLTSVPSSLKHLNGEDLEDFVFWEAVPPQQISCWEISLYQMKRPWSVLSCSVFRNNRSATTPGVILDNLKNGGSLDERFLQSEKMSIMAPSKTNSFDVEPSIAQKNIDIRNWLAALNFHNPVSNFPKYLDEKNLCKQLCKNSVANKKQMFGQKRRGVNGVKDDKKKIKREERTKSENKIQSPVPLARNFSEFKKKLKEKSKEVKGLLDVPNLVQEQTRCVYMLQVAPNIARCRRVRKSEEDKKPEQEKKKKENRNALPGLVRKSSGGFVTPEQFAASSDPPKVDKRRSGSEEKKIRSKKETCVTSWEEEDPVKIFTRVAELRHVSLQVAEPSGVIVHRHECELKSDQGSDSQRFGGKPEEARKAMVEYGKQFSKNSFEEMRKKERLQPQESRVIFGQELETADDVERWVQPSAPALRSRFRRNVVFCTILVVLGFVVFFFLNVHFRHLLFGVFDSFGHKSAN